MSIRLVLVAARNCSREAFTRAFALDPEFEVHENCGYLWYLASFWGSDRDAIRRGMAELPGPNIFMETHDGAFWNLFIQAQGQEPFFCHHDFSWLYAFEHPEDLDELEGDSFFDDEAQAWEFFGYDLPAELSQGLESSDGRTALSAYYGRQARHVVDALARFGIPHSREEVISILTGETVTENELETDIGNLPRLLVSLGFGPYFEEMLQGVLSPEEDEPEYDEEPYEFDFTRMEDGPVVPITEGPCEIPVQDLGCLLQIACFCDPEIACGMRIRLVSGQEDGFVPDFPAWAFPQQQDNEWKLSMEEGILPATDEGKGLLAALEGLPSGSNLELATRGESTAAGCHRYVGTVTNRVYRIASVHPKLSSATLLEAVDLVRAIDLEAPMFGRDEAEVSAVIEASRADPAFDIGSRLDQDGLQFVIEPWQRFHLAKHLFRRRFAGTWTVEPAAAVEREEHEEITRMAESLVSLFPGVPSTNEIVYHGTSEVYYQADTSVLRSPEKIAATDKQLAGMGFNVLGDFCGATQLKDVLIHGYVHPAEAIYGVLFLGLIGDSFDFFTRFDDGTSVTTTSLPSVQFSASRDSVFQCGGTEDLHTLFNRHIAFIGKKKLQGVNTVPFGHTAKDLAKEIDDFLGRL
ncbi:MAG: hypothetical protein AB1646_11425 [Thermodesulfobacteriota bacterium]